MPIEQELTTPPTSPDISAGEHGFSRRQFLRAAAFELAAAGASIIGFGSRQSFAQEGSDISTPTPFAPVLTETPIPLTPSEQFFASYEWNPATDTVSVTPDGETLQVTRDGETFNTPVIKVNITDRYAGDELGFYEAVRHESGTISNPVVVEYLNSRMVENTEDRIHIEGITSEEGPFLQIVSVVPSRDGSDAFVLVNTLSTHLLWPGSDVVFETDGEFNNSTHGVSLQDTYDYLQNNYRPGATMLFDLAEYENYGGDISNAAALRQWWETGDRSVLPEEVQSRGYMVVLSGGVAIRPLKQQPATVAQESS